MMLTFSSSELAVLIENVHVPPELGPFPYSETAVKDLTERELITNGMPTSAVTDFFTHTAQFDHKFTGMLIDYAHRIDLPDITLPYNLAAGVRDTPRVVIILTVNEAENLITRWIGINGVITIDIMEYLPGNQIISSIFAHAIKDLCDPLDVWDTEEGERTFAVNDLSQLAGKQGEAFSVEGLSQQVTDHENFLQQFAEPYQATLFGCIEKDALDISFLSTGKAYITSHVEGFKGRKNLVITGFNHDSLHQSFEALLQKQGES